MYQDLVPDLLRTVACMYQDLVPDLLRIKAVAVVAVPFGCACDVIELDVPQGLRHDWA